MDEKEISTDNSKKITSKKKKNKGKVSGGKVVTVVLLGIVLSCSVVFMGMILFTDLFTGQSFISEITSYANGSDGGLFGSSGKKNDSSIKGLSATYTGGELYAGGQAIADNFVVEIEYADGTTKAVTDYNCDMLSEDARLVEGTNSFEFEYNGVSTTVRVNAVNARNYAYPPDYVTVKVDAEAAKDKVAKIESGSVTFADALSNVAFTGDSQIKALSSYEIIPEDRIVAKVGESIDYFEANFTNVVNITAGKDVLIVHYGINTLTNDENDQTLRIEQYKEILSRLKETIPNVRIIVSGVFPVGNTIINDQDRFAYITDYDFKIFELCEELGIDYLSDNRYITDNQDVFGGDGLHLTSDFYKTYWLNNLITVMGL